MTPCGAVNPRRVAGVATLALVLVLIAASPASAHATLLQTDPAPGAVLQQPPQAVTLNFDSPVAAAPDAVRVFDRNGNRVDAGRLDVSGATVRLALPHLRNGSYVVTWRVTSADTHPVGGAFTFQIGTAGNATSPAVTGLAQRLLGTQGGDRVVGVLYGATRWLVFTGLALFLGAAAFALLVWPAGRRSRRAVRLVWAGWALLLTGTVTGFVLYGPYAAGLGLGDATRLSLLKDTLQVRFGELVAIRVLLLLLCIPMLRSTFGDRADPTRTPSRTVGVVAAGFAILLASTPGLAAHAVTGRWVTAAVVADTFHVLAMAIWLGGLVVMVSVLLPTRRIAELRETLPRWSRLAAGCVAVIVLTGVFQAYRQVGGLAELRSTDYGRLLTVKLVVFAIMLTLASFGREIVLRLSPRLTVEPRRPVAVVAGGSDDDHPDQTNDRDRYFEPDSAKDVHSLRRSVWLEVGAGAAVLAVTALLVNAPPARSATAVTASANGSEVTVAMKSSEIGVDVILTPGRAGPNDVHVTVLRPDGTPGDPAALRLSLDLPGKKIAPIPVPLAQISTGHYLATSFAIPIAGTWRVTAYPLLSQFDEATVTGVLKLG